MHSEKKTNPHSQSHHLRRLRTAKTITTTAGSHKKKQSEKSLASQGITHQTDAMRRSNRRL
jgi:hypothetical protein